MNRTAKGMLLQGPADYEVEGLRADGYRPEKAERQMINDAIFESEWSQRLAPYRNSRVMRDFVIHRHLQLELIDMLVREQMPRGIGIDDIFTTPESGARFVMSMPSSAVMVSMKAQYHQDPNHRWSANDLYDIEALSLAVAYYDIVFADAAARDNLLRRGLATHFDTALPRSPEELTTMLGIMADEVAPLP